jgi:hypothetical protein
VWRDQGLKLFVAVNVSMGDLTRADSADFVHGAGRNVVLGAIVNVSIGLERQLDMRTVPGRRAAPTVTPTQSWRAAWS